MNTAHRLADSIRSLVSHLTPTASTSHFVSKGTLTPAEFVDSGDQLTFKFPTWQWRISDYRRQVSWLPPDKQYLLTKNVPCRRRVSELDSSLRKVHLEDDQWLIAGEDDPSVDCVADVTYLHSGEAEGFNSSQSSIRKGLHSESNVRNVVRESNCASVHNRSEKDEDGNDNQNMIDATADEFLESDIVVVDSYDSKDESYDKTKATQNHSASSTKENSSIVQKWKPDDILDVTMFQEVDDLLVDDDVDSSAVLEYEMTSDMNAMGMRCDGNAESPNFATSRTYDLSITYDKYYQTPRLWLFGYNEDGLPLTPDLIAQDIHSDYISKTITIDPHPCTGIPTVSIHPCKHAEVMRKVVRGWIDAKLEPRHDMSLFVLLKFIASAVPTIEYDFTMDVDMFAIPH